MKALLIATITTAALSAGAIGAQSQDETDRAMGAGSYVHPNGSANGAWTTAAAAIRYSGAGEKQKAR